MEVWYNFKPGWSTPIYHRHSKNLEETTSVEDRENSPSLQPEEEAKNSSSEYLNKGLGSSFVPKIPSTDVARPDTSPFSAEGNGFAKRSPPSRSPPLLHQRGHYLDQGLRTNGTRAIDGT
ncbi:hypothetical protein TNCV_1603931 [Trichonephila clavipes]|nr:hypothetical protein TNCV_1603931 [Trichonephila clavipes]